MTREKVKVGLLGVGLDTYWKQFDGLLARLLSYQDSISSQIGAMDAEVINVGMVDTPEKARQSAMFLKQADVEVVFLFISTYALSSTILPVAQVVGKPIVMLNVQPTSAIDYAFVKKNPIAPRKLFAALFVILLTVVVPVVYIFCKEQLVALIAEYRNSKQ